MQRYGRDFQGWHPGMSGGDRGYGARSFGRYGGDYRGGWSGPGYDRYPEEAQGGWTPGYEGWGYSQRDVSDRTQGWRGGRGIPRSGQWRTGEPWGSESDVDQVRAADIMTANPEVVTGDTPLAEVAKKMRDLDVGIMPVVDSEENLHLQGVITDRDIAVRAAAEGKDMKKAKASDFMTPQVETVGESDHLRDVFTVMKRERVRRVPVTDAKGRLVGIIAQADLAVNYAGLDVQREAEVEEVIERISEPARPRWGPQGGGMPVRAHRPGRARSGGYDEDLTGRLRDGWRTLRREARQMLGRGYDQGWR